MVKKLSAKIQYFFVISWQKIKNIDNQTQKKCVRLKSDAFFI